MATEQLASAFEKAADAVVDGDTPSLAQLLGDHPDLVHTRSQRDHRATLLHYVSANGVEDARQRTPANVIGITQLLLDAGAEIDAEANVYGGGATTLALVATSVHPERAGVQNALMQLLLDRGADIEHGSQGTSRNAILMSALANGRGAAAEFIAERVELDALSAAAVGRLDVLRGLLDAAHGQQPAPTSGDMETGFLYACLYGHANVVTFLLDRGVKITARDPHGQTALHLAAMGGHTGIVSALLARNASMELVNVWGGTVLGQTTWCVINQPRSHYAGVIRTLLDAGADPGQAMYPTGNAEIDGMLARTR